ncbi:MAG: lysophospholipid acyltransferase family protein [Fluviibacter sp.]
MSRLQTPDNLSLKHRCYLSLVCWLARLPLPLLQAIGAVVGRLVYLCSASFRRLFDANLTQALGPDAVRLHSVRAQAESGKAVFEVPWLWLHPREETLKTLQRIEGWEHVQAARAAGKGILFLTPHLGCFEITAQYAASQPDASPITVLFRPPRQRWAESILRFGRTRAGMQIAPADLSGVRRLIRALKSGESVGLLPDQVPPAGQGAWLPWFGKPAYTMTLAARLAQTGASVIFACAERLPKGQGFVLSCRPPSSPLPVDDLEATAAAINQELMKLISSYPEQYFWGYNRYKTPRGSSERPPEKPL